MFGAGSWAEVLGNSKYPGRYDPGQRRTLQRKVRVGRAEHGPDREVTFEQSHRSGGAGQTDFTAEAELLVTIAEVAFPHLLCVFVLPYSNSQWPTACRSESLASLPRHQNSRRQ